MDEIVRHNLSLQLAIVLDRASYNTRNVRLLKQALFLDRAQPTVHTALLKQAFVLDRATNNTCHMALPRLALVLDRTRTTLHTILLTLVFVLDRTQTTRNTVLPGQAIVVDRASTMRIALRGVLLERIRRDLKLIHILGRELRDSHTSILRRST